MPELLALTSAVVFGLVHFFSGLLSRQASSSAVAVVGQLGGLCLVGGAAFFFPASYLSGEALWWGALSGIGTGLGVAFLYRGLGSGQMSIVAPLSDVGAVAVPVLVGVALFGDRPSVVAWIGVLAALPALWLVSRQSLVKTSSTVTGAVDGALAGLAFALQFIAISRVDLDAAGLWPIVAARVAATGTIVPFAWWSGASLRMPRRLLLPAAFVGASGSVAILVYLFAVQAQLFALATVLSALYPVIPVILALVFLRERLRRPQVAGLVLTGLAIGSISVG